MVVPADKVCLVVIDGWGMSSPDPAAHPGDAIRQAKTPTMDSLMAQYGCCPLLAHGEAVGLPAGLMGNSEVGHLNIGAGRVVYQDILRIDLLLKEANLCASSTAFSNAVRNAKGNTLHLIGLLSDGGVHSHIRHLLSLLDHLKAAGADSVAIHAIADGRDTAPTCLPTYICALQKHLAATGSTAHLASVCGRYYAMDRDSRWERTKEAFDAMVLAQGEHCAMEDLISTINARYEKGETDEFLRPIIIGEGTKIVDGDTLVFFNFRSDRMRQLVQAFGSTQLGKALPFEGHLPVRLHITTMTRYREDFSFPLLSPPQQMTAVLAEQLSSLGLTQLHVAETEKFSHVTVFFNGGREKAFPGEERILVPSPKVATYDLLPAMSSAGVAEAVCNALNKQSFAFVMCNLAPPDMVGHTGCLHEAVEAVEATDAAISRIFSACQANGYTLMVTADHGNAEKMLDEGGAPHKAHTCATVPLIVAKEGTKLVEREGTALCDVAPTVLALMGLSIPTEMTGKALI